MKETTDTKILILDFGSQFTQLIGRRIREIGVYTEIIPFYTSKAPIYKPAAIILSGSSDSVYKSNAQKIPLWVFDLKVPILGICYGQQAICEKFGGKVEESSVKGFGRSQIKILKQSKILGDFWKVNESYQVWASHGDKIVQNAKEFDVIATSDSAPFAIIANEEKQIYGVQFHPEVIHNNIDGHEIISGKELLKNFVINIAGCKAEWQMHSFKDNAIRVIQETVVKNEKVVCAVSGGVDSSVVALLLHKAIGSNLHCIFIDNGLLRKNEAEEVMQKFKSTHPELQIKCIDAKSKFLNALSGVQDPESKRKIIGKIFIETFKSEIDKIGSIRYLAQGTIYPDVIESLVQEEEQPAQEQYCNGGGDARDLNNKQQRPVLESQKRVVKAIKSHHNVGGLPKDMYGLELIEPIRMLFKDEVRELGKELDLNINILERHPFPGPGLAIRIIGEVTQEKCDILRKADHIYISELHNHGLYNKIWQAYAALLSSKSVGVMGDARTYDYICVLRAVNSVDGMTADFIDLPHEFLSLVSRRIVNEVNGISRVMYDITSKPPATIELE